MYIEIYRSQFLIVEDSFTTSETCISSCAQTQISDN